MRQALIVLIPLFGSFLPGLLSRWLKPAYTAGALTAVALGIALFLSPVVFDGGTLIQSWPWMPEAGLNLAFRLDGYALLFVSLILGIGLLIVLYAHYYLGPEEPVGRFYSFLLLFMGAMLGVVTSENLLLLVVFWELTGLSSFLLIGFWSHMEQARQGARLALLITGAGGLALLAGVLLIGSIVGSYELTDVLAAGDLIKADARYSIVLALVLGGAFTKSAQFPFHFWLPHAMSAPTPVSAYLHSATMVKAGIFLLGRLFPALSGTPEWFFAVSGTGFATLVIASYIALYRHDLKGLLAYSTVSHLGLVTLLFGIGSTFGAIAAVFHIINHGVQGFALYVGRHHRSRNRHARYSPLGRAGALHAADRVARHRGGGGHGGRAAAQRLSKQRDVFYRVVQHSLAGGLLLGAAVDRHRGGRVHRGVFGAVRS
jgi:multicomponent K+:H+ antiporter subunit A